MVTQSPFPSRRLALSLALFFCVLDITFAQAAMPDVRILIDVSGSMRKNDPRNLRIPALRLVTQLLPEGAKAGVWLFDETAKAIVPLGSVNAMWKKQARAESTKINARGQFTDIENGLNTASVDWKTPTTPDSPRHIILLTDGMVDVSENAAERAQSRARLLSTTLPRLRMLGAHIHAIALSAEADSALLDAMAHGTDGWFQSINTASSLQRIFLHLFEQAATPDSLPLRDNHFTIDPSVRELTVLVFHHPDGPPLELVAPDGAHLTRASTSDSLVWESEEGYDMVTLTRPRAGTWSLNAPVDPDNRALVVTDLSLKLDELPTHLMPDEPLPVIARLLEHGKPEIRQEFLKLVKADTATLGAAGKGDVATLTLDSRESYFNGTGATLRDPGDYELIVRAEGPTFQREHHHHFKIDGPPFKFRATEAKDDTGARVIHLSTVANPDLVSNGSFSGLLELRTPGAPPQVLEIPPLEGNEITLELAAPSAGKYILQPWIFAETRAGRSFRLKPDPMMITFADGTKTAQTSAPLTSQASASDWERTVLVILAGNCALALPIACLGWLARRRNRSEPRLSL